MNKVQYTEEQRLAIETKDKNILVSAAAGSGKTRVLVDRIIRLVVEDQIPLEAMLIVTFTNAAANEMRARIQNSLLEAYEEGAGDRQFLRKQLHQLPNANISTLHAFCIREIRNHFHLLDLEPGFAVLNQATEIILREQAIEEVFESLYQEGDPDFLKFVEAFSNRRSDRKAVDFILEMHNFLQSQPNPTEWLEEKIQKLQVSKDTLINSNLGKSWMKSMSENIRAVVMAAQQARQQSEKAGLFSYSQTLEVDEKKLINIKQYLDQGDLEKALCQIRQFSFEKLNRLKKTEKEMADESEIEQIKHIRNQEVKAVFQGIQKKWAEKSLDKAVEESKISYHYMRIAQKILLQFMEKFQEKKRDKNSLDFSDLEHYMLQLLERPEVRESFQSTIQYIFFDEYQDANLVQEKIIACIQGKENLFFVGDIKQSIYRFRLADPTLFHDRYKRYVEGTNSGDMKIDLSKNFRSCREILEFSNFIFGSLMTEDLGEVDYQAEGQQLVAGREFGTTEDAITLALLPDESAENSNEKKNPEAVYIAKEILRLTAKDGGQRKLNFKDIVVLIRSPRAVIQDYESVFKDYGIPFYSDVSTVNFCNREVETFIDMLQVIDNDMQDSPLLGVLLSVPGGFSEEELAEVRIAFPEGPFYQALQSYRDNKEDPLALKIEEFYRQIHSYREELQLMRLSEFAWYLLKESGYQTFLQALPGGKDRINNVKAFIAKIRQYEASSTGGLYGFLHYVNQLLDKQGDNLEPAANLSEKDNVVRFMSIHKSKGLEFQVVFLAGLARNFNFKDMNDSILFHNKMGIGLKNVDLDRSTTSEPIQRLLIKEQKNREMLSEEVRLLYVAMTRAIQRLYLVGKSKDYLNDILKYTKGDLGSVLLKQRCFQNWILAILSRDALAVTLFPELAGKLPTSTDFFQGRHPAIAFVHPTMDELEEDGLAILPGQSLEESIFQGEKLNRQETTQLTSRLEYVYPYLNQTVKPYKQTVSQLSKKNLIDFDNKRPWEPWNRKEALEQQLLGSRRIPTFMKKQKIWSPAERGKIVHFVFQNIVIDHHNKESIARELDRLVDQELLTAEDRSQVREEDFLFFFQTELGKRLIQNRASVQRETSFMMTYEGYTVDGQIDCFFIEDGKGIILDFKTDQKRRSDKYVKQLELYALALEKSLGIPVEEKYVYWTNFGLWTKI